MLKNTASSASFEMDMKADFESFKHWKAQLLAIIEKSCLSFSKTNLASYETVMLSDQEFARTKDLQD